MKTVVIASKLRDNNEEVGALVSVELPEINLGTEEVKGAGFLGTSDLPATGQVEAMEATINTRGMDKQHVALLKMGVHKFALLFVQDSFSVQKGVVPEGCKIYMDAVFKGYSPGSVEQMSAQEGSFVYEVLRYQVIVDGRELLLIDKVNSIFKVDGQDQMQDVRSMLN